MVVLDEIKGSSINKKPNSTMSVMLCTGATFVKKNSCLVARVVPFDTVGLHLLTFRILDPYPSKDRPSYLGRRTANFARASSLAEQNFAGGLKCHDSTST